MKVTLVSCFALTLASLSLANNLKTTHKDQILPENQIFISGKTQNQATQSAPKPFQVNSSPGVVVGSGWYDFQVNGSVGKRMVKDENNALHLTAISANLYTTDPGTNTTRGSFYSWSPDGISWGLSDGAGGVTPIWTRVENARGGFPAIDYFRNSSINGLGGSAFVISHFNDPLYNGAARSIGSIDLGPGQGLWEHPVFPQVPNATDQPIWPAITIGANDKAHVVATTSGTTNVFYYSSLSGPFATSFDTWIPMANLPGVYITPTPASKTFVSDYANHLVCLFHESPTDTLTASNALFKFESLDNGATWTFDNVTDDTPIPYSNSTNIEDYPWRAWLHYDTIFDASGNLHYVWTEHRTTSSGAYYPSAFKMMYKNVATNQVTEVFDFLDTYNGNPVSGSIFEDGTSWGNFATPPSGAALGGGWHQIVGVPHIGMDTNNAIHLIFEGFPLGDVDWANMPNGDSTNAMVHGDIWHTMSTNGGQTWGFGGQSANITQIENITHSQGWDERYPMCPPLRMTAGFVEVAFQTDDVAGAYSFNGGAPVSPLPALGTAFNYYKHANGTGTLYSIALVTDLKDKTNNPVASSYELKQNYPNPFNPTTKIEFSVEKTTQLELSVFNLKGQLVKTLFAGNVVGSKTFEWNGTDFNGQLVSSGTYFYTLKSPEFSQTKKMTFVK
ncbi:T9SS type A sorting domain-containing protein [bacterium]|nr:T9SS type A sorting domain-containing protein [bacterium]